MGFGESLFAFLNEPGSSLRLFPLIRIVCCAIIVLCIVMYVKDVARVHMVVLSFLALGLLGSVQFLVNELEKAGGVKNVIATSGDNGGDVKKEIEGKCD
mmetsp:Transcript_14224/g.29210  ORF Transcript_14224/g.29210 Transcript_14224/m.29210 type:complete len:99 (+) Transcript_14224:40-336(+)